MENQTRTVAQQMLVVGDLASAKPLIDAAIEVSPDDLEASYLLGLLLLQEGDAEQAVEHLQKVAQQEPENASYLCNLGVAMLRARRADEAVAYLKQALELRPDYVQARYSLGSAYIAGKQPELAEDQFRELCWRDEDNADYQCARADALREMGKWRQALALYHKALQLNPDFSRAHTNLGPMLAHFGQADEALAHCLRAVELSPESAQVRKNLGDCLFLLERFEEAMDAYADAYDIDPKNAELCVAIGRGWLETNALEEAGSWFHLACHLDESNVAAQCGLANIIREVGNVDGAIELLTPLLEKHPDEVEVLVSMADACWDSGDAELAIEKLCKVRELQPQRLAIYGKIGQILSSSGEVEQAIDIYQTALAENASCIPALSGLAMTQRGKLDPVHVNEMKRLLESDKMRQGQRAALHNGLAHYFDGRKEPEMASRHSRKANSYQWASRTVRGWSYEPRDFEAMITRTIETFNADYFHRLAETGCGNDSSVPVFVVAMPRSGTTLTEQILGRHSQVLGIGERPFTANFYAEFNAMCDREGSRVLSSLSSAACNNITGIAGRYSTRLNGLIEESGKQGVRRVVDKMPDNYSQLGWILTLFPNAKIIHVKRDPRDVALSCWMTQFGSIRWACNTEHLTERIRQYQRVMRHWREVIPDRIFEFDYEALVAEQEKVSRQLVEWIGLDWEPQCLEFYDSDRLVRTASITQVRQPIYKKSVAKWRRYEPFLHDLFDAIQP
jgi:tetratricopeptide (TPR) repeat protein